MALEARRFYLDVQARQFVSSPDSTLPAFDSAWFDEDVESIELYGLKPTENPSQPYEYVDLSGATVKFAVGTTTPAALQTGWTPLSTVVGTTVTSLLFGGSGGSEIKKLAFTGAVPASGSFALQFPSRNITVSTVSSGICTSVNHGLYDGQLVTLGNSFTISGFVAVGIAYSVVGSTKDTLQIATSAGGTPLVWDAVSGGTATLPIITTQSIPYNATAEDLQNTLAAAGFAIDGESEILVSGTPRKEFVLIFGGRLIGREYNFSVVGSTLAGAKGIAANVSFNTSEVAALVAAGTTNVNLEVEISEGAVRQTFRRPATLSGDIITSTSPVPLPLNSPTSFNIQSQDGSVWTVTMTNDGNLEWTKQ